LAAIKQLAGQTIWYGLSNVGAKLLNYALTPILTYLMVSGSAQVQYGNMTLIYAWAAVLNILFTYGFETAYFRFYNKEGAEHSKIFETAFGSIVFSTSLFALVLFFFRQPIANFFEIGQFTHYITWCIAFLSLDALSAIPFARLRQENKPRKYAFIKLFGIVINLSVILFLMVYFPHVAEKNPENAISKWYLHQNELGYILFANLLQSLFVFLALFQEWKGFRFKIEKHIWRQMIQYSSPMIIVGLAGMVNEVMDRQLLAWRLPFEVADNKKLIAIYSANYKLAIFITLFLQAFKMAAEPFFFNQAKEKNAPVVYARVMKWFVITLAIAFLFTTLYLDLLQYFVGTAYRSGLGIVPILLAANVFLGIYYNLSVWYKLTDRMRMGMYITLIGAGITLVGNYYFIPAWGYYASAWTTCICYFSMMVITYYMGQKYFPVPYPVKKIISYLVCALLLFVLQQVIIYITQSLGITAQLILRTLSGSLGMLAFIWLAFTVEKQELKNMPILGKLIRK
jgi:O-antigen/teichoic acid export membrane protein